MTPARKPLPVWREHLAQTLLATLVAGLVALCGWSGRVLWNFHGQLQAVVSSVSDAAADEEVIDKHGLQYLDLVEKDMERSHARIAAADGLFRGPLSRSEAARLRRAAQHNVEQATLELGALSGYSSETTGIPDSYLGTVRGRFNREISFWKAEDRYATLLSTGKRPPASAADEVNSQLLGMEYSGSLMQSETEDLKVHLTLRDDRWKRVVGTAEERVDSIGTEGKVAVLGLFVSMIGFELLLRALAASRRARDDSSAAAHDAGAASQP